MVQPLVVAVVPLGQVGVDRVDGSPASSAVSQGPPARAGQHQAGCTSASTARSARGLALAGGRQGDVGAPGVLARTGSTRSRRGGPARPRPSSQRIGQRRRPAGRARGAGLRRSRPSLRRRRRRVGRTAHAAFLVSQKMVSISAIRSSSFWPSAGSTDALAAGGAGLLGGAVEQVVQLRVLLEVRRLEVVGPQHPEVVLDQLGALLLDDAARGSGTPGPRCPGTSPGSP